MNTPMPSPDYVASVERAACTDVVRAILSNRPATPPAIAFLIALMGSVTEPGKYGRLETMRLIALAAFAPDNLDPEVHERFGQSGDYEVLPEYRYRYARELLGVFSGALQPARPAPQ